MRRIMRKFISAFFIISMLLLTTMAYAEETEPADNKKPLLTGGWKNILHEAGELPEDVQDVFDKATENLDGAVYTPVALLSTQLVAGMNYCILCQIMPVVPNSDASWALMYIYADLEGNAEITNVYELYIPQHSTPKE